MLTWLIVVAIALALLLAARPELGLSREGRAFAFCALVVLPMFVLLFGVETHVERSKTTAFCTSCHVMDLHGRSLRIDDDSLLVAAHYQRGLVPRDTACFSCHTTYTMYGDVAAKLRGLRHVWVNYLRGAPKETDIRTYTPYHNRECLHCHEGTRRFEGGKVHRLEPGRMEKIRRNEVSCIGKGCHDTVHEAGALGDTADWKPPEDAPVVGGSR